LFDPQLSPDDRPLVTLFCEQARRTDVGPNVEYLDTTPFSNSGIFKSSEGTKWAVEITFDAGRKSQTKDLRPDLPLIIHY